MKSLFIFLSLLISTYSYSTNFLTKECVLTDLDKYTQESPSDSYVIILDMIPEYQQKQIQQAINIFLLNLTEYYSQLEPAIKDTSIQKQLLEQKLQYIVSLNDPNYSLRNVPSIIQVIAEKQQVLNNVSIMKNRILKNLLDELRTNIITILRDCTTVSSSDLQFIIDILIDKSLNTTVQSNDNNTHNDSYEYSDTQYQCEVDNKFADENLESDYLYTE